MEVGIEKGLLKGMEKFAIEMIQNSEPIDKIQKYTGLSIEQIEDLRKRVK